MFSFLASLPHVEHPGEALSVAAALTWAVAVILFRISGRVVHPLGLNFFKSSLSSLLLIFTALIAGEQIFLGVPLETYGMFALSGFIGIALSDTFFFACLNLLGAGLTAIVECLYSPFVIILSLMFLGEKTTGFQLFGVLLIIMSILLISRKKPEQNIPQRHLFLGILFGAVSMFLMAAGIVMVKPLLNHVPLLWATFMRVFAGALSLGIFLIFHPRRRALGRPLLVPKNWIAMVPAAFLGSYIGLVAWMGGMKFTQASIAAPLNQLSTIFIFLLAAIFLREKVTAVKLAAIGLAFVGAFLASFP